MASANSTTRGVGETRKEDADRDRDRDRDRGRVRDSPPRGRRSGGGYRATSRYWDSDDYRRGSRDYDRGRGRRSRSRSRDRDRSYSRSRSRTRSLSRGRDRGSKKAEEQKPVPAPVSKPPTVLPAAPAPPSIQLPQLYEPTYAPEVPLKGGWAPVGGTKDAYAQHPTQASQNGQSKHQYYPPPELSQYGLSSYQEQPAVLQKEADSGSRGGSGLGSNYSLHSAVAPTKSTYVPAPIGATARTTEESSENSAKLEKEKKKKDSKKKKSKKKRSRKSKSSSSSSSSSSSEESSGSRSNKRRRAKKRSSDSTSGTSSEEEKVTEKSKKIVPAAAPTSISEGLTPEQRKALLKQEEGYKGKLDILKREIARLESKEDELAKSKSDMKLIEENLKLQAELKSRCNAVNVVLKKINDVLHGGTITAEGKPRPPPPPPPKLSQISTPAPTVPAVQQVTLVSSSGLDIIKPKTDTSASLDFIDNGNHWCRLCNVFPTSLKDLLDHFHSKEHHLQNEQIGIEERPWHKRIPVKDTKPEPGAKKVPFRGMQFFTPVQGWYCRLCNAWMGDHHCATEHLKSEEHYSNFTNFLTEHPGWETKYENDRSKARLLAGFPPETEVGGKPQKPGSKYNPVNLDFDTGRSIRDQMLSLAKEEQDRSANKASILLSSNINAAAASLKAKDMSAVDEWMGKSQKLTLDILDTQKFAEIVRQKHGLKKEKEQREREKEKEDKKPSVPAPPPPTLRNAKEDRDREADENKKRYADREKKGDLRVELTLGSSRGRDRDRGGNGRDSGRDRKRSRSRSRSRERGGGRDRDRYGSSRRGKSRSKSRERERPREKDSKPEVKEPVRKLPIIGKMPLYNKKPGYGRDAAATTAKAPVTTPTPAPAPVIVPVTNEYGPSGSEYGPSVPFSMQPTPQPAPQIYNPYQEERKSEASMSGYGYTHGYPMVPESNQAVASYGFHTEDAAMGNNTGAYNAGLANQAPEVVEMEHAKPEAPEKETSTASGPVALPDDLQHALDLIYAGPGTGKPGPITFPPPSVAAPPAPVPVPEPTQAHNYDYSGNSYNYMDYQPYQHNFDGYGPADYSELDDGPPGINDSGPPGPAGYAGPPPPRTDPSAGVKRVSAYDPKLSIETASAFEDDIEDLRMLGIDVEDAAAANFK